jgi:hypothetical protein
VKSLASAALTVLATAAVLMVAASPASAHTSLIDVQPGEGETVSEGTTVSLTFSEALLELGTEMIATDASGESFPLVVERPDPAMVAAQLPALAQGSVTVSWRVVAGDGHPIEGTLGYVADAAADADDGGEVPSPGATASSSEPTPSPTATEPSASAVPEQGETSEGSGLNWGLWIAIAAAIFAATAVATVAKRRR